MEQEKQKISVSLDLFNKMFGVLTQLPFKDVNGLIVEIQQELSQPQTPANAVADEPKKK